jgi:hypothetical protein
MTTRVRAGGRDSIVSRLPETRINSDHCPLKQRFFHQIQQNRSNSKSAKSCNARRLLN